MAWLGFAEEQHWLVGVLGCSLFLTKKDDSLLDGQSAVQSPVARPIGLAGAVFTVSPFFPSPMERSFSASANLGQFYPIRVVVATGNGVLRLSTLSNQGGPL